MTMAGLAPTFLFFCVVASMISLSERSAIAQQSLSDLHLEAIQPADQRDPSAALNPFAGGAVSASDLAVEELVLTGTVRNEDEQYALLSGYLVRPGDRIAGYRVDQIDESRVVLKRLDEVYILPMEGGF